MFISSKGGYVFGLVLMFLPIVTFYICLAINVVNVPFLDDYADPVSYLNHFSQLSSVREKITCVLTQQHFESKPVVLNAVAAVQYTLFGHRLDIPALVLLGNLLVIPIFVVCVLIAKRRDARWGDQLLMLTPIAYFVFQLQYASTLDWVVGTLENMSIVAFSLLSIWFLTKESRAAFSAALIAMTLAVFSVGNGVLVILIGVLILLKDRRYRRLVIWLTVSILLGALYMWRYKFGEHPVVGAAFIDATPRALEHFKGVIYALSFLGASAAGSTSYVPSAIFGAILCCALVPLIIKTKLHKSNAAAFYSIVFIFATAVLVATLRNHYGIAQSLSSRYRIYSNLLLVFFYLLVVNAIRPPRLKAIFVAATVVLSMCFSIASDRAGERFLHNRKLAIIYGAEKWEGKNVTLSGVDDVTRKHVQADIFQPDGDTLKTAKKLGVYSLPPNL